MIDDTQAPEAGFESDDNDGADDFFADLTGKPKKEHEDAEEEEPEAPEPEPEEDEDEAEGEPEPEPEEDGPEVDIEVNGETRKVKLSDLKALYGRQDEFTRSTEELTKTREETVAKANRAVQSLDKMIERAQEKFKPYAELDWLGLSAKLMQQGKEEDWNAIRTDALAVKADLDFLVSERDATVKSATEVVSQVNAEQAQRAVATLSGPVDKGGIAGWSQELYGDILKFAVEQGVPQATATAMVDPVAIRTLHQAMLYQQSQKTALGKIAVAKADTSKMGRPGSSGTPGTTKTTAAARLARSGSVDDAADAFLESFGI